MKLDSFRDLLIKKSGDPSLENLITFVKEDVLAELVIESLEKMARAKHKGDAANVPMRDFGVEMDPETEPNMIHDALSHHASRYKSALKAGRKDLANKHANQIFRTMDMADQAQKHSQGKLHVEAVSPHAWERQGKTRKFTADDKPVQNGNKRVGQFVTDTKGWRYRDTGNGFDFLQGAPHESYGNEIRKHGHNKAYPLEQMRVNGKYLDVKDVPSDELKGYEEHPFDKHPIMSHFEKPAGKRSPEEDQQWRAEHAAYGASPHMDSYFDKQAAEEQADPDKYAKRGSSPSMPVHSDVPGLEQDKKGEEPSQAPAAQPGVVTRPAAATNSDMSPEDRIKTIMESKMPEHIKQSMIRSIKNE